jgi:aspartate-semialdehyde dehydrogenase
MHSGRRVIRCHSAAITLKLKREVSEAEFAELVTHSHPWVNYIPNNKQESVSKLTPAAISGSLQVGIGRYKKMSLNNEPDSLGIDWAISYYGARRNLYAAC